MAFIPDLPPSISKALAKEGINAKDLVQDIRQTLDTLHPFTGMMMGFLEEETTDKDGEPNHIVSNIIIILSMVLTEQRRLDANVEKLLNLYGEHNVH